jgi:hypothetical protein
MIRSAFWTFPQALAWILRKDLDLVNRLADPRAGVGDLHRLLEKREWEVDVDPPVERTVKQWDVRVDRDQQGKRRVAYEEKERINERVFVHGRRSGEEIELAIRDLIDAVRDGKVTPTDYETGLPVGVPPAAVMRPGYPVGHDAWWSIVSFFSTQVMAVWKPGRTKPGQIAIRLTAWMKMQGAAPPTMEDAREWFDTTFRDHPAHQFRAAWRDVPAHLKRRRGKRGPQKNPK